MYEHLGEPEDAWANLCPETELNRDECIMERSTEQHTDDYTDTIPDINENETAKGDILYQVQQSSLSNEEMFCIVENLNDTQKKVFYFVREWCLKKIIHETPALKPFSLSCLQL